MARDRGDGPRLPDAGVIVPEWPVPPGVRAAFTTRAGGVSAAPFDSLNLAGHVGDEPAAVAENRRRLRAALALPAEPLWLTQVHGCAAVDAAAAAPGAEADAAVAFGPGTVCAVQTADCLPILLCDRAGSRVAAVHAGWRGLAAGVVEAAVTALEAEPEEVVAWLGPAIGPDAFEVGDEVRATFVAADPDAAGHFFPAAGRWRADLYGLARRRLAACGITAVYGGDLCTFSDPGRFFSYRRDGATGRMAALVWLG